MNCNTYPGSLLGSEFSNNYGGYSSGLPCGYDVCAALQYGGCEGQLFSDGTIRPNGALAGLNLPCQNSSNWNYDQCYSYYANGCYNTCQFINMGDIEDFMWVRAGIGAFEGRVTSREALPAIGWFTRFILIWIWGCCATAIMLLMMEVCCTAAFWFVINSIAHCNLLIVKALRFFS